MKTIGPILIIVLILVVGVGAYYFFTEDLTSEKELQRAERNMRELDSVSSRVELIMQTTGEGLEAGASLIADTKIDYANKAGQSDLEIEAKFAENIFHLTGQITYVDDALYGRLDSFPEVALREINIGAFAGENILFVEGLSEEINVLLEDYFEMIGKDPLTLGEVITKAIELEGEIWERGAAKVTEVEEDEVDGEKMKKYTVVFEPEAFTKLVYEEFLELLLPAEFLVEMGEEMKEEMQKAYEDMDMELYIWSDGRYIHKIKTVTEEMVEDMLGEEEEQRQMMKYIIEHNLGIAPEELPESIKTTIIVRYSDFNERMDITPPEEYFLPEELMERADNIDSWPGQRLEEAREVTRDRHMVDIATAFHLTVLDEELSDMTELIGTGGCTAEFNVNLRGGPDCSLAEIDCYELNEACADSVGMWKALTNPGYENNYVIKVSSDSDVKIKVIAHDDEGNVLESIER